MEVPSGRKRHQRLPGTGVVNSSPAQSARKQAAQQEIVAVVEGMDREATEEYAKQLARVDQQLDAILQRLGRIEWLLRQGRQDD